MINLITKSKFPLICILMLILAACQNSSSTPQPIVFDGRMLFYGSTGILEVISGREATFHPWNEANFEFVAASENGDYVLISSHEKSALLSTLTWQVTELDFGESNGTETFSADGKKLARVAANRVVIYDTTTAQQHDLFSPKCHKYSPGSNLVGGDWCLRVENVYWLSSDQLLVTHAAGLFDNHYVFPESITVYKDQDNAVFGSVDTISVIQLDGDFHGQFALNKMIRWVENGNIFTSGETYNEYQYYSVTDLLNGIESPIAYHTEPAFIPAPILKDAPYIMKDGQYIDKKSGTVVKLTSEPVDNLGCRHASEASLQACLLETHQNPSSATVALYPRDGEIVSFTINIPESIVPPRWVAWKTNDQ